MSGTQMLSHLEVRQKASEELVENIFTQQIRQCNAVLSPKFMRLELLYATRTTSCDYTYTNSVLGKLAGV